VDFPQRRPVHLRTRRRGASSARSRSGWAAKKALIVTDPPLVKAGLDQRLREPLAAAGVAVEVFPGGEPERRSGGDACVVTARQFRPDVLIALARRNMDLAKIGRHGPRPGRHAARLHRRRPRFPAPSGRSCACRRPPAPAPRSPAAVLTDTDNQ